MKVGDAKSRGRQAGRTTEKEEDPPLMNTIVKTLGALVIAGTVAAGGSAFTGGGLTRTADATQFVGGTVSQTISGATLTDIGYTLNTSAPGKSTVTSVNLAFAEDISDQVVSATLTNDANPVVNQTITPCVIAGDGLSAVCTSPTGGGFPDLVALSVTVAPPA